MTLFKYYFLAFVPLIFIALLSIILKVNLLILLVSYYFYRVALDYYKLKTKKIINKNDKWKFIVPIWTIIYFDDLYLR